MSTSSPQPSSNVHQEYISLSENFELLENQIKIFESREIWTGIKLTRLFSHQKLIKLHLFNNHNTQDEFEIMAFNNGNYQILKDDNLLFTFSICPHLVYTPITDFKLKNMEISMHKYTDCLYC